MAQFLDATTQNIASQELYHISVIHIDIKKLRKAEYFAEFWHSKTLIGVKIACILRIICYAQRAEYLKKIGIIPNITEGSFKNKLGPFFHPPPFRQCQEGTLFDSLSECNLLPNGLLGKSSPFGDKKYSMCFIVYLLGMFGYSLSSAYILSMAFYCGVCFIFHSSVSN
jgi:hypothetical protein